MRWLVTGAGGMLGHDVVAELLTRGNLVVGPDRSALDITDPDAVSKAFREHRFDVVVNCAAYTAVDAAETDEEAALAVNGDGPRVLARACAEHGVKLVHVSTDYVFSGQARDTPYPEDHPTGPLTAYGRTKLAGERAVLEELPDASVVVRTAWLYGVHGPNFVRTMLDLEGRKDTVDVVDDQRGQPTWSADVAERLVHLGARLCRPDAVHGVFHATSSGETSWYELAREVYRLAGADPTRVRPTGTSAFPRPAPRPAYSVLGHERWREAGFAPPRDWRSALHEALPLIRKESLS